MASPPPKGEVTPSWAPQLIIDSCVEACAQAVPFRRVQGGVATVHRHYAGYYGLRWCFLPFGLEAGVLNDGLAVGRVLIDRILISTDHLHLLGASCWEANHA